MPKVLSEAQVASFREEGFCGPIPALTPAEAAAARAQLEDFEARQPAMVPKLDLKAHLLLPWLCDLAHHARIGDAMADILGPDVLLWNTSFRVKEPDGRTFVSWHQDTAYIRLKPLVCICWLALSPATRMSGCLEVIPGSHRWGELAHDDTFAADNMLTRGQRIAVPFDESAAVALELAPGEMALIDYAIAHRSAPNTSDDRRIGLLIDCVPAHARQESGRRESAMVLRGVDRHGNFDRDPRPDGELTPAALAAHRRAVERQSATMYDGAETAPVALS